MNAGWMRDEKKASGRESNNQTRMRVNGVKNKGERGKMN
jgi:hypothetical protein